LRIAVADRGSLGAGEASKRAVPDREARMPGRGAYLCRGGYPNLPAVADSACLERALRRGGISRALRSSVTLERKLVESPWGDAAGSSPAGQAPLSLTQP
jgi:predicted RNA-binding protein YlxR (DUF448 family)